MISKFLSIFLLHPKWREAVHPQSPSWISGTAAAPAGFAALAWQVGIDCPGLLELLGCSAGSRLSQGRSLCCPSLPPQPPEPFPHTEKERDVLGEESSPKVQGIQRDQRHLQEVNSSREV